MKCPYCGYEESKVIDSRSADDGERIRRRRECLKCGKRFTTHEIIETVPIIVVKRDKSREVFDRNKLTAGILRACEKRPVSIQQIETMVNTIETKIQSALERQVTTPAKSVNLRWKKSKRWTRFPLSPSLPVYRQFKDINTFLESLTSCSPKKITACNS